MQVQIPDDTPARIRIRALLKLMVLGGTLVLLAVFLSYVFSRPGETGDDTLRVELDGIAPGAMSAWSGMSAESSCCIGTLRCSRPLARTPSW